MPFGNFLIFGGFSLYYFLFMTHVFYIAKKFKKYKFDPILQVFIFVAALGLVQTLTSSAPNVAFFRAIILGYYLLFYFFCREMISLNAQKILDSYVYAVSILSFFLIFNYLSDIKLGGSRFVIKNYNQNDLAFLLSLGFIFCIFRFSGIRKLFILILITFSVFLTASRSNFLILIISSFFYLFGNISFFRLIFSLLSGFLGFYFILSFVPANLQNRLFSILDAASSDAGGRYDIWEKAFNQFNSSLLWGDGLGTFSFYSGASVHNFFLQILVEQGFLSLFALIIFFCWISKLAFRNSGNIAFSLSIFSGLLVYMNTQNSLYMYAFWLALAVLSEKLNKVNRS